jgi:hypothetical protein
MADLEQTALVLPRELTQPVREALSFMNFQTGPMSNLFRRCGHQIPKKCEDEQAYVLHWLLCIALEHCEGWREVAARKLDEMAASCQPPATTETPKDGD